MGGKYRLGHVLGKGAMGSVWAATHLGLDTQVAVKFMALSAYAADEEHGSSASSKSITAAARFEREAKSAAQVRSANIVQVFDYGIDCGVPYIVMELLEGQTLQERLEREKRLVPEEAARIMQAVARALGRAHDAGLVHRDLKPGNIFLAKEGDREVPKVFDFGVARPIVKEPREASESSDSTVEGTIVGTPSYMSPEQAMGRTDVDARTDLWSLGVIAFQMLTGKKPFASKAFLESVVQICSAPIPLATALAPGLPPQTDAFFARALERDRERRFQSAREMANAFYALVARPLATSLPPPALEAAAQPTVPVHVEVVDATAAHGDVRGVGGRPARLILAVAAGAIVLAVAVTLLLRSKPTPTQPPAPYGSATAAAPQLPPAEPAVTDSAPAAAASAPVSLESVAVPPAAPPSATPRARTAPQPGSATPHKPKHDLGY